MQPFNPAEFLILVVDDVSKNLQILGSILDEVGYSTTFAISGLQALERLETAKPDLILLDMMMPDMDGLEVCSILKSDPDTAEIPVIFLTASQETEHILQAFDKGAVDYLTKPFNTRELLARVRNHLELKHTRDQLKKALQELVESRDAALKSAQVKSQFLANMSHEIRTPMNGVLGMTELLLQTPLNPQQIDYVQTLRNSGNNLLVIINEILDYSKLESGEMRLDYEEFELKNRLAEITKFFQSQIINKDLNLKFIYDESIPQRVIGDFHKIRQILTNLIGNAIKFTEIGEIQVIVTKKSGLYREITSKNLINNQEFANKKYQNRCQLKFEVKDTGIGIRAEDQAQIFKSFFQADSSPSRHYAGTGLGLAICEQLVQLMNGKIGVESEFGKGSTFWFTINLEFLPPDLAAGSLNDLIDLKTNPITDNQQIETEQKSLESIKILVVEDTRINQKVIQQQLKRLGCTADCVNNGQEALYQLDAADYDLILMDCQMPVLDGYAATEMIREREQQAQAAMRSRSGADALSGSTSNLPSSNHGSGRSYPKSRIVVIGLTAYAMKGDREKCLAAGMDDYLSKPVSINDLSAMLRKWAGN
jgi:CheY-like chemotaxis protein